MIPAGNVECQDEGRPIETVNIWVNRINYYFSFELFKLCLTGESQNYNIV